MLTPNTMSEVGMICYIATTPACKGDAHFPILTFSILWLVHTVAITFLLVVHAVPPPLLCPPQIHKIIYPMQGIFMISLLCVYTLAFKII